MQRHSLTRCQAIRRLRTRLYRPNSQPSSFHLRRDRPGYTIAACRQNFQKPLAFFFPSSPSSLSNIFVALLGTFSFDFFRSKVDSSMELGGRRPVRLCVIFSTYRKPSLRTKPVWHRKGTVSFNNAGFTRSTIYNLIYAILIVSKK